MKTISPDLKTRHTLLEETKHIEALRSLVEAFSANQKNDQKGASPNPPDGAGMYLQAGTASHRSFSSNPECIGCINTLEIPKSAVKSQDVGNFDLKKT